MIFPRGILYLNETQYCQPDKKPGPIYKQDAPGAIAQFKWGWDGLLRFGDSYTRLLVFTKERLHFVSVALLPCCIITINVPPILNVREVIFLCSKTYNRRFRGIFRWGPRLFWPPRLTEAQQRAILWIKKFEAPSKNPDRLLSVLPA
jgi:hypothetical protein